jgi:hypothetical protein
MNFYTILGYVAVWSVPIAPVAFFSLHIYDSLSPRLGYYAIAVGVVGALGFELIGILNGHAMVTFYSQKRYNFAAIAAILLLSYVAIGLYELGFAIGGLMILAGFLMYITQGLLAEYHSGKAEKQAADESRRQSQLAAQRAQMEREKLAAELEHQRQLAMIAARKEIKLAETSQKVPETFPAPSESFPKVSETFPRDSRRFRPEHWEKLRRMDEAEIVLMAGVDIKTARAWMKKLAQMEAQQ